MKPVVGLTGGIASGKSTAAAIFAELGVDCIDADDVAKAIVAKGEPALQQIAEQFGPDILLESGELNRPALRSLVFSNPAKLKWLEGLTHPLVYKRLKDWREGIKSHYGILVSPLLLERRQHHTVDRVLLIDVPPEVQIQRTMARDGSREHEAQAIMASQMARHEKKELADDIILNDGDLASLRKKVQSQHDAYMKL
ncbi:dephospho-CoA kinase [Allohahella marinimesophila]|uniref:Dephospho-CoA kinase n=1 Tax=Allohahella marinimesophila TaxID=1054972 RepID=A0ABP7PYI8_9GAMM